MKPKIVYFTLISIIIIFTLFNFPKKVYGNQNSSNESIQDSILLKINSRGWDLFSSNNINEISFFISKFPNNESVEFLKKRRKKLFKSRVNVINAGINVDSLLKSPSTMRGRDFALILASLSDLNYAVEWRIINAAEYGMPQRRKRVFIMAYKEGTKIHSKISKLKASGNLFNWVANDGVLQDAFPMTFKDELFSTFNKIKGDFQKISLNNKFSFDSKIQPFSNAGVMMNRTIFSQKGFSVEYKGTPVFLRDILQKEQVAEEFFLPKAEPCPSLLDKWLYLKGSKNLIKTSKTGHKYPYAEGPVTFPDALNRASRTIITGEGGKSPSRFKHVVKTKSGRLRRLTPYELEKLNMFPGNLTKSKSISDGKRAFFM